MTALRSLLTRRQLLQGAAAVGAWSVLGPATVSGQPRTAIARPRAAGASEAGSIDLVIDDFDLPIDGRVGRGMAVNNAIPGPIVRLREGREAVLHVTNRLHEVASIHWHGLILPPDMDGVPGVSFGGIQPGETFTYRFPVEQSGTYWAHSHSGGQELLGVYFPLIIDPIERHPFAYDREHVILLSDWSFESPEAIIGHLKKQTGYYNRQRRTLGDFSQDVRNNGWLATFRERASWSKMRMDPSDFADVTGYTYTYLMNGLSPVGNWTGQFSPGEKVRLRFIDGGAMTYFDIRIPGLRMTVVQADGQNVQPVEVDEFRIGPGETYDVIVEPDDRAYTVFAESLDRSGFTRGTLAPREGMSATVPPRRKRPVRTMADMGMEMAPAGMKSMKSMKGMEGMEGMEGMPEMPESAVVRHARDSHGPGSSSIAMLARSRVDDPGSGFDDPEARVLVYADLKSVAPFADRREPERDVELHITGNMERYMFSFDGKKYSEAKVAIHFRYGERLRLVLVNDTMMEHPIHLHGMWMELENGAGDFQPRKHTVSVKPAERLTVAITADAPGRWAMHCHLLLHMEMGMFRVVEVSGTTERAP